MKKIFAKMVWALAVLFVVAIPVSVLAELVTVEKALLPYGWTIDFSKQERSLFGFNWNLICDPKYAFLPTEGKNIFSDVVCKQGDKAYYTSIMWRLPSVTSASFEKNRADIMAGGGGHGKVICREEVVPSEVAPKGVVRDCEVPLQHGTFFVSYYHFLLPMPVGGSYVDEDDKKVETLEYTIWIQNAHYVPSLGVPEKMRQLVALIRMPKK